MPTHAKMPSAMKREMCAHGGPVHCDMGCYAEGGSVRDKFHRDAVDARKYSEKQTGVHNVRFASPGNKETYGESDAGYSAKGGLNKQAKDDHHKVLAEMRADKTDRRNLAEGGYVHKEKREHTYHPDNPIKQWQPGVHNAPDEKRPGESDMGRAIRGRKGHGSEDTISKDEVEMKREQLRRQKGPHGNYAEGGEVDDEPKEDDMSDMIADELMDAFHRKDKRGVKDAIEALVMECMNKGEM